MYMNVYTQSSENIVKDQGKSLCEKEYQEAFYETVSSRNGCINKTGTIEISMNTLMWKGKVFVASHF